MLSIRWRDDEWKYLREETLFDENFFLWILISFFTGH
jgi:hypothetical protein